MSNLFMKGRIGSMVLENRIIMTAIHTGFSMEKEAAFLERRVKGGAAAVTAVMGVSRTGASVNMSVLAPENRERLRSMAAAIHKGSGKLLIQLFHAGRNGALGLLADTEAYPVAPSPIPSPIYKEMPRELTADEIREIVSEFGRAAALCREAGVDGVEISCSAGYLLSQFFSPLTNRRTDEYGGDPESRMRFPLEVIREVRNAVGAGYPVILRVSAGDMLGGYGIRDTVALVKAAEEFIDAVNVTGGWHESEVPQISMQVPEGGFAFLAGEVKRNVSIPVIACNRINNKETAEAVIGQGYADFAGCARAFLTDSDFINKMKQGIPYRRCIGCNKGCIEKVLKMQEVTCVFNPEVGRETEPAVKRETARKILVAGGGPAGIEAALQFAKRGDKVQLCTNEEMIGGLLHIAAKAPYKETIARNIKAMRGELERYKVKVKCGSSVDKSCIERYGPDFIVVATGSVPMQIPVPGANQRHVYTAQQVLKAGDSFDAFPGKGKILIVGGGSVGMETALYLAKKLKLTEAGRKFLSDYAEKPISEDLSCGSGITIVEMGGKMGADLGGLRRIMVKELTSYGVEMITNARVEEISEKDVVLNKEGGVFFREADLVILAAGYCPQGQSLINWLKKSGEYPYQIIGDAAKVGNIAKALKEAYEVARM
ncbi:MAG TPA: FAD-dependent oxidoreductase [Anaerovoracaceae bacterium]|nr:FAD-dependent oxidoreductase [Anaerovoracaceae bacterium]